jgi:hypothetical protein
MRRGGGGRDGKNMKFRLTFPARAYIIYITITKCTAILSARRMDMAMKKMTCPSCGREVKLHVAGNFGGDAINVGTLKLLGGADLFFTGGIIKKLPCSVQSHSISPFLYYINFITFS